MNKNIRKLVRHGNIAEATPLILTAIDNGTLDSETCVAIIANITDTDLLKRVKVYSAVKEKLSILCDFAIINENTNGYTAMFKVLKKCGSDVEIDRTVHDLLVGNETLAHFFTRKGVSM